MNSTGKDRRSPLFSDEEARAKARVSSVATQRIASFQRVLAILPFIEQAREELAYEYDQKGYNKSIGDNAVANWLNDQIEKTNDPRLATPGGRKWGPRQVRDNIMEAPDRMVESIVLECRTRMTAVALSADFTKPEEAVTDLEQEYLGFIAEALDLGHRLNGHRKRTKEELWEEARRKAIEVAADQRRKKPVSMMARERLWKHFPPVVRKVFEK